MTRYVFATLAAAASIAAFAGTALAQPPAPAPMQTPNPSYATVAMEIDITGFCFRTDQARGGVLQRPQLHGDARRSRPLLSEMHDGARFFWVARTIRKHVGGHRSPHTVFAVGIGCDVRNARELVYADGVDLDSREAAVPVGVTCRLCDRMDCEQRAFPPLQHPLKIDEHVRGVSFYAPAPR